MAEEQKGSASQTAVLDRAKPSAPNNTGEKPTASGIHPENLKDRGVATPEDKAAMENDLEAIQAGKDLDDELAKLTGEPEPHKALESLATPPTEAPIHTEEALPQAAAGEPQSLAEAAGNTPPPPDATVAQQAAVEPPGGEAATNTNQPITDKLTLRGTVTTTEDIARQAGGVGRAAEKAGIDKTRAEARQARIDARTAKYGLRGNEAWAARKAKIVAKATGRGVKATVSPTEWSARRQLREEKLGIEDKGVVERKAKSAVDVAKGAAEKTKNALVVTKEGIASITNKSYDTMRTRGVQDRTAIEVGLKTLAAGGTMPMPEALRASVAEHVQKIQAEQSSDDKADTEGRFKRTRAVLGRGKDAVGSLRDKATFQIDSIKKLEASTLAGLNAAIESGDPVKVAEAEAKYGEKLVRDFIDFRTGSIQLEEHFTKQALDATGTEMAQSMLAVSMTAKEAAPLVAELQTFVIDAIQDSKQPEPTTDADKKAAHTRKELRQIEYGTAIDRFLQGTPEGRAVLAKHPELAKDAYKFSANVESFVQATADAVRTKEMHLEGSGATVEAAVAEYFAEHVGDQGLDVELYGKASQEVSEIEVRAAKELAEIVSQWQNASGEDDPKSAQAKIDAFDRSAGARAKSAAEDAGKYTKLAAARAITRKGLVVGGTVVATTLGAGGITVALVPAAVAGALTGSAFGAWLGGKNAEIAAREKIGLAKMEKQLNKSGVKVDLSAGTPARNIADIGDKAQQDAAAKAHVEAATKAARRQGAIIGAVAGGAIAAGMAEAHSVISTGESAAYASEAKPKGPKAVDPETWDKHAIPVDKTETFDKSQKGKLNTHLVKDKSGEVSLRLEQVNEKGDAKHGFFAFEVKGHAPIVLKADDVTKENSYFDLQPNSDAAVELADGTTMSQKELADLVMGDKGRTVFNKLATNDKLFNDKTNTTVHLDDHQTELFRVNHLWSVDYKQTKDGTIITHEVEADPGSGELAKSLDKGLGARVGDLRIPGAEVKGGALVDARDNNNTFIGKDEWKHLDSTLKQMQFKDSNGKDLQVHATSEDGNLVIRNADGQPLIENIRYVDTSGKPPQLTWTAPRGDITADSENRLTFSLDDVKEQKVVVKPADINDVTIKTGDIAFDGNNHKFNTRNSDLYVKDQGIVDVKVQDDGKDIIETTEQLQRDAAGLDTLKFAGLPTDAKVEFVFNLDTKNWSAVAIDKDNHDMGSLGEFKVSPDGKTITVDNAISKGKLTLENDVPTFKGEVKGGSINLADKEQTSPKPPKLEEDREEETHKQPASPDKTTSADLKKWDDLTVKTKSTDFEGTGAPKDNAELSMNTHVTEKGNLRIEQTKSTDIPAKDVKEVNFAVFQTEKHGSILVQLEDGKDGSKHLDLNPTSTDQSDLVHYIKADGSLGEMPRGEFSKLILDDKQFAALKGHKGHLSETLEHKVFDTNRFGTAYVEMKNELPVMKDGAVQYKHIASSHGSGDLAKGETSPKPKDITEDSVSKDIGGAKDAKTVWKNYDVDVKNPKFYEGSLEQRMGSQVVDGKIRFEQRGGSADSFAFQVRDGDALRTIIVDGTKTKNGTLRFDLDPTSNEPIKMHGLKSGETPLTQKQFAELVLNSKADSKDFLKDFGKGDLSLSEEKNLLKGVDTVSSFNSKTETYYASLIGDGKLPKGEISGAEAPGATTEPTITVTEGGKKVTFNGTEYSIDSKNPNLQHVKIIPQQNGADIVTDSGGRTLAQVTYDATGKPSYTSNYGTVILDKDKKTITFGTEEVNGKKIDIGNKDSLNTFDLAPGQKGRANAEAFTPDANGDFTIGDKKFSIGDAKWDAKNGLTTKDGTPPLSVDQVQHDIELLKYMKFQDANGKPLDVKFVFDPASQKWDVVTVGDPTQKIPANIVVVDNLSVVKGTGDWKTINYDVVTSITVPTAAEPQPKVVAYPGAMNKIIDLENVVPAKQPEPTNQPSMPEKQAPQPTASPSASASPEPSPSNSASPAPTESPASDQPKTVVPTGDQSGAVPPAEGAQLFVLDAGSSEGREIQGPSELRGDATTGLSFVDESKIKTQVLTPQELTTFKNGLDTMIAKDGNTEAQKYDLVYQNGRWDIVSDKKKHFVTDVKFDANGVVVGTGVDGKFYLDAEKVWHYDAEKQGSLVGTLPNNSKEPSGGDGGSFISDILPYAAGGVVALAGLGLIGNLLLRRKKREGNNVPSSPAPTPADVLTPHAVAFSPSLGGGGTIEEQARDYLANVIHFSRRTDIDDPSVLAYGFSSGVLEQPQSDSLRNVLFQETQDAYPRLLLDPVIALIDQKLNDSASLDAEIGVTGPAMRHLIAVLAKAPATLSEDEERIVASITGFNEYNTLESEETVKNILTYLSGRPLTPPAAPSSFPTPPPVATPLPFGSTPTPPPANPPFTGYQAFDISGIAPNDQEDAARNYLENEVGVRVPSVSPIAVAGGFSEGAFETPQRSSGRDRLVGVTTDEEADILEPIVTFLDEKLNTDRNGGALPSNANIGITRDGINRLRELISPLVWATPQELAEQRRVLDAINVYNGDKNDSIAQIEAVEMVLAYLANQPLPQTPPPSTPPPAPPGPRGRPSGNQPDDDQNIV